MSYRMELHISCNHRIEDIQKAFTAFYPYLKIEFYKAGATHPFVFLKPLTSFNKSGVINVEGGRTVSQLENDFLDLIGFSVQVFRKSGTVWIATSLTGDWTLDQQNKEAAFINSGGDNPVFYYKNDTNY